MKHTDHSPSFFSVNDYLTEIEPDDLMAVVAKAFFMATCDRLEIEDMENEIKT